jgi:diguanylate cyclase (GGDEF)-like protein/PAS domain S-box-containing protein
VAGYALAGIGWILFSDILVHALLPETSHYAQLIKGVGFVAVTAAALFFLLRRHDTRTQRLFAALSGRETELSRLNGFLETVIDNTRVLINAMDADGRITVWNRAAEELTGYRRDEVLGHNQVWEWVYPDPDHRAWVWEQVSALLRGERELTELDVTLTARDGTQRTLRWQARPLDENGGAGGAVAVGYDVTERLAAQAARDESERRMATLLANLPGMAYRCAPDNRWTMHFVSQGSQAITGYQPAELEGNRTVAFGDLIHPDDQLPVQERVALTTHNHQPFAVEYRLLDRDGELHWIWEQGRAVVDHGTCVLEGILLDITDRKRMEDELKHLAARDLLTGLLNRRELEGRLAEEVDRARRYQRPLGIILLDLDAFKELNDSQGHAAGDAALRSVGRLINENLREADFAARYGGDELLIVAPESGPEATLELAERLRRLVIEQAPPATPLSLSLGFANYPDNGDTGEALLLAADRALYRAKAGGRNRVGTPGPPVNPG